jgi:hypothetical protein
MLLTGQALARRLEAAEAYNGFKAARSRWRAIIRKPERWLVAGGYAIFCGVGSPLTPSR